MIAAWMGYWFAVSVLVALAAMLAERTCRVAHRPTRWVWAMAIVASLAAPALLPLLQRASRDTRAAEHAPAPAVTRSPASLPSVVEAPAPGPIRSAASHALSNSLLLAAWALASIALAVRLAIALRRLKRLRRTWRVAEVAGVPVCVSPDIGPAVAGFIRPAIVVPEWVLSAPPSDQRLILHHEREHMRAGDPVMLLAARIVVALTPWNAVLWWLAHRLRLAIELDCDARVLCRVPDVSAYGALLIEVGRRVSSRRVVPLAALSDPPTFLERRISMLSTHRPRHAVLTALAVVVLSAIPAAAATVVPRPANARLTLGAPWRANAARGDSIAPQALHAMQVSMKNLMVAQEAYYSDFGKYAPSIETMGEARYKPEAGVTIRITWADNNSYVVEASDVLSRDATCIVHVNWIPRSAWPTTALEKKSGPEGHIVCDGDGKPSHAEWQLDVPAYMTSQLQALVLPQERARGATGTYPDDASKIDGNSFDPALHFTFLWADTASWAAKAVYDSMPGRSCVVWAGSSPVSHSRPRIFARTDAQHRFPGSGEVACDDF